MRLITQLIFLIPLAFFLFIAPPTSPQVPKACGVVDSCDYLVSSALFTKGTCGRAARCLWEFAHLQKGLKGVTNNKDKEIKEALCNIPTMGVYHEVYDEEPEDFYNVCGLPLTDKQKMDQTIRDRFQFYPMTTFYIFDNHKTGDKPVYLKRMEACTKVEASCSESLHKEIWELCAKLDRPTLERVEKEFNMRLRHKKFYKIALLNHDILDSLKRDFSHDGEILFGGINNCSLLQLYRKRFEDGENNDSTNGTPTFEDFYHLKEGLLTVGGTAQKYELRPRDPWFDLYILYQADFDGKFKLLPDEDRWWNETKSFHELAHYLPEDVLQHSTDAIKCVYDRVNLPEEMPYKPEKFCWSTSTFMCVDKAKASAIGNTCGGTVFTEKRHDNKSAPVPEWKWADVFYEKTTTTPAPGTAPTGPTP